MHHDQQYPPDDEWNFGADAVTKPSDNILVEFQTAVRFLHRAQVRREKLEALEKEASKVEEEYRTKIVPEIMARGGAMMREISCELEDGTKVTVILDENHVSAKLSNGNRDKVFQYMKENGEDHLASNNVIVPFTKGQEQELEQFMEFLKTCKLPITPGQKQDIHPSTYSAMCKKLVEAKAPIKYEDFGIHVQSRVTLVEPKTKRKNKKTV